MKLSYKLYIVIPRNGSVSPELFPDARVMYIPALERHAFVLEVPVEEAKRLERLLEKLERSRKADVIRLMVFERFQLEGGEHGKFEMNERS